MGKSMRDLIFEGKKARIATGLAGAGLGTAGAITGSIGSAMEREASKEVKRFEDLRKSADESLLGKAGKT